MMKLPTSNVPIRMIHFQLRLLPPQCQYPTSLLDDIICPLSLSISPAIVARFDHLQPPSLSSQHMSTRVFNGDTILQPLQLSVLYLSFEHELSFQGSHNDLQRKRGSDIDYSSLSSSYSIFPPFHLLRGKRCHLRKSHHGFATAEY